MHIANEDQFKEVKNVLDKYYGVSTKKLDELDSLDKNQATREQLEILQRRHVNKMQDSR